MIDWSRMIMEPTLSDAGIQFPHSEIRWSVDYPRWGIMATLAKEPVNPVSMLHPSTISKQIGMLPD